MRWVMLSNPFIFRLISFVQLGFSRVLPWFTGRKIAKVQILIKQRNMWKWALQQPDLRLLRSSPVWEKVKSHLEGLLALLSLRKSLRGCTLDETELFLSEDAAQRRTTGRVWAGGEGKLGKYEVGRQEDGWEDVWKERKKAKEYRVGQIFRF